MPHVFGIGRKFTRLVTSGAFVAGLLLAVAAPPSAHAQEEVSVDQLRRNFDRAYKNELVIVQGWVNTERRVSSRTYKGFYLKDRFGALVLVRTTQPLPDITAEIQVKGVALRDADTGDVYLTEVNREVVTPKAGTSAAGGAPATGAAPDAVSAAAQQQIDEARRQAQEAQKKAEEERQRLQQAEQDRQRLLIGLAVVAGLVLVGGGFFLMRRPQAAAPAPYSAEPPAFAPAPGAAPVAMPTVPAAPAPAGGTTLQEFKTVKVYKTTKVMPGQLVVMEGGRETDIIPLSDQSGRGEIEVGRDSPDVTGGIRIKDRTNTMSRRQARLTFAPATREFTLVNLANEASNPTIVNSRQMKENESVTLKDGDVLIMGSLEVKFRAR